MKTYDCVVVGSGPNGLAAAIKMAQADLSVLLIEGKSSIGGGMRSAELTLPGFTHDICSAVHPLGIGSPFFSSLPLNQYGLRWIQPDIPLAHPFADGTAVILDRSVEMTSSYLGPDGLAYAKLMNPYVSEWNKLATDLLAPLHFPHHPIALAQFSYYALRSARGLAHQLFKERSARALFAGLAAHAIMPLEKSLTAAFGLVLGSLGHAVGWPVPAGGSQFLADALASHFVALGGEIQTNTMIKHLDEIPSCRTIFLDLTPKQLLKIVGNHFPNGYSKRLQKYRYGPGVFKIDWALERSIPWKAIECSKAGTVHLGGTLEEIAESERFVWEGHIPKKNFIIVAQPSLFDPSRAPAGKHVGWAYCHVPNRSKVDMTEQIESQIEELAPGFRASILKRSTLSAYELEHYNPNYVGGDINGGVQDLFQLFSRPLLRAVPYSTPIQGLYICSSSTPPGGGVHGMCGYYAAEAALKTDFGKFP